MLHKLWAGPSHHIRPLQFVHFQGLPKIPRTSDSAFPLEPQGFSSQLCELSLFGAARVPQGSRALSPPDRNRLLGLRLYRNSELEELHSNPGRFLMASALWLTKWYLGTFKPYSLGVWGEGV